MLFAILVAPFFGLSAMDVSMLRGEDVQKLCSMLPYLLEHPRQVV
jgi:hypothetical protein